MLARCRVGEIVCSAESPSRCVEIEASSPLHENWIFIHTDKHIPIVIYILLASTTRLCRQFRIGDGMSKMDFEMRRLLQIIL